MAAVTVSFAFGLVALMEVDAWGVSSRRGIRSRPDEIVNEMPRTVLGSLDA